DRLARRALRSGARLAKATLVVLVALHAWLLMWGMARAPQAYAETFYAHGGIRRLVQIAATDVLGVRGCLSVGALTLLVFLLGWPWTWRAYPTRLASATRRWRELVSSRAAIAAAAAVVFIVAWEEIPRAHATSARSGRPNVVILA